MRINTNISALNAYRMNTGNNTMAEKSLQKLSSGLRINKAGDDAAGLAISEKMRGQIRGLDQASRNIQDGISLIQTAEGAMQEVHSLLQRGREISVQAANGTLTTEDRNSVQLEVDQIIQEIDRIANTTNFNTIKLLDSPSADSDTMRILTGLKSAWLQQSENLITNYYGLTGDGAQLQINIVQGAAGGTAASVSGLYFGTGLGINLNLNIEKADFIPGTLPNGTNPYGPIYDDRIIAHEMTHAVMARTMNFFNLPTWFKEGAAEFASGADERLYGDSGGGTDFASVVSEISAWGGTSIDYSSAYAAVRYLHEELKAAGATGGVRDVMTWLNTNQPGTLDDALNAMQTAHPALAFNSVASFVGDYETNGVAFLSGLNTAGAFTNADTGAIGGADADGGASRDAASVVPDTVNFTDNPLTGFQEIWPTTQNSPSIKFQVGANTRQMLDFSLCDLRSASLGLNNVDLVNQASAAIDAFNSAIGSVSTERAELGAIQNRLEHALSVTSIMDENLTAGESRIRDTDMAKEMMVFTKTKILTQASTSMLAQANMQPQAVLRLLQAS